MGEKDYEYQYFLVILDQTEFQLLSEELKIENYLLSKIVFESELLKD